jgi:hypothetical protein
MRRLMRGRLSRGGPHRITDRSESFLSPAVKGARSRIPGGGGFFWPTVDGNGLRRPWICCRRGCLDGVATRGGGDGESMTDRSRSRGGRRGGGEVEAGTRSARGAVLFSLTSKESMTMKATTSLGEEAIRPIQQRALLLRDRSRLLGAGPRSLPAVARRASRSREGGTRRRRRKGLLRAFEEKEREGGGVNVLFMYNLDSGLVENELSTVPLDWMGIKCAAKVFQSIIPK